MKLAGATTATAVLAGCLDGDDDVDDANGNGDDDVDDANGNDGDDVDDANGNDDDDVDDANGNDDDDVDDAKENNKFEIEPDTRIVLDGQTPGWIGKEPAAIEGVVNPTLILEEGGEYEIGWDEGDEQVHNIQIVDEDENVVDDLETEWVADPEGDEQFLEFTASEEMAGYQCEPHPVAMLGDIVVESNGNDGVEENAEFEIDPDTTIVLDGQTFGWVGKEPAVIEGVENPTLVLEEGAEYEIGWDEGDGMDHNIQIVDEDENVVDDLETEWVADPEGDEQFLEFEASEEMAVYVCEPHPVSMRGDLVIEDSEKNSDR